jgi:hypothetical protein
MHFERIEDLCRRAEDNILLVAPFVKRHVLETLLDAVKPSVEVTTVTRWWPEEIASGVSDVDIWELFRSHERRSLWLRHDLHAKIYCSDKGCLVGSANLTGKGLGLAARPNLELLIPAKRDDPDVIEFEASLLDGSVQVDDDLYETTRRIVATLASIVPTEQAAAPSTTPDPVRRNDIGWFPRLRHPADLYLVYSADFALLTPEAIRSAQDDLEYLQIPAGLHPDEFSAAVSLRLLSSPIVSKVDRFVSLKSRRFGEVRDFISQIGMPGDPSRQWQVLLRWIMNFLPDRYEYRRPAFTEIIARR